MKKEDMTIGSSKVTVEYSEDGRLTFYCYNSTYPERPLERLLDAFKSGKIKSFNDWIEDATKSYEDYNKNLDEVSREVPPHLTQFQWDYLLLQYPNKQPNELAYMF